MEINAAKRLVRETFEKPFDKLQYYKLIKNIFKHLNESNNFLWAGNRIPNAGAFQPYINSIERLGKYEEGTNQIDVLIVNLKKTEMLERARTMQRNFVARYLDDKKKNAALVAFVSPEGKDWRFSLVKMDYTIPESPDGRLKIETELTPARRYSFLVGEHESSHTAQKQLLSILTDDRAPALVDFENAFGVEVVTREFFTKYHSLYDDVLTALQNLIKINAIVGDEFTARNIDPVNFAKKLLGQIVFLYFLQKKGWLGVPADKCWGEGNKRFLRDLYNKAAQKKENFFNGYLEYLFYDALAKRDRPSFDPAYYPRFDCKIPFLNGGLFDPIGDYHWVDTDIILPNTLFSNIIKTDEGDTGTGILDVFDRYNFTVKEDEPLEKEVAVDPEMLGKVFENLLEVKDRKSKGTYYTPREIVHYMCQESLINYLDTVLNTGKVALGTERTVNLKLTGIGEPAFQQQAFKTEGYTNRVPREDIETFIRLGETAIEHEAVAVRRQEKIAQGLQKTTEIKIKLRSIQENAQAIDEALKHVRVCDPAIGSGAFPVGIMTEIVRARHTLTSYLPDKTDRTSYDFKRHAIQHCLYGVDIDPGAVEIAKLRLWLSMVVDEEEIKNIKPLPNLDYKIVCGNSLIGVKRVEGDMFSNELERLKSLYFNETISEKKEGLRKQIQQLIISLTRNTEVFVFEIYFSEVFHEKGGFDVVIANPPYGVKVDDYIQEWHGLGSNDSYGIFISTALKRFLKLGGILQYIVSDSWLTIKTHKPLREQVLAKQLHKIIRVHQDCFEAAVNACIISLTNSPNSNGNVIAADLTNISTRKEVEEMRDKLYHLKDYIGQATPKFAVYEYKQGLIKTNANQPIFVGSPRLFGLMNDLDCPTTERVIGVKQEKVSVRLVKYNGKIIEILRLGDIADIKKGIDTGENRYFLLKASSENGSETELIDENLVLKMQEIEHLSSYEKLHGVDYSQYGGRYLIPYDKGGSSDTSEGWLPNYYVQTGFFLKWSKEYVKELRIRANRPSGQHKSTIRNEEYWFKRGITFSSTGVYAPTFRINSGALFDNKGSTCFCKYFDQELLLGILCSKFSKYILKVFIQNNVEFSVDALKWFIMINNSKQIEDTIKQLVSAIISKQKANPHYDFMLNEQKKIDKLVYEMYGLNAEDIREVETWYSRRYPKLARFCETSDVVS